MRCESGGAQLGHGDPVLAAFLDGGVWKGQGHVALRLDGEGCGRGPDGRERDYGDLGQLALRIVAEESQHPIHHRAEQLSYFFIMKYTFIARYPSL